MNFEEVPQFLEDFCTLGLTRKHEKREVVLDYFYVVNLSEVLHKTDFKPPKIQELIPFTKISLTTTPADKILFLHLRKYL
jgi:hypothetical protein